MRLSEFQGPSSRFQVSGFKLTFKVVALAPALRRVAVLISALDAEAADTILAQIGEQDAAKIRNALVELPEISPDEQQEALAAFLNAQGKSNSQPVAATENVTLELNPAVEAAVASAASQPAASLAQPSESPSFAFLAGVDAKPIAAILSQELPQTVAVVVAHLPPEQAAAVLQELPPALATDALERIAWIGEPAADIQWDVIRVLRERLAPHLRAAGADATSLARLSAVLGAMDDRQRQRVVQQLGQRNQVLLDRLGLSPSKPPTLDRNGVVSMRYRLDSGPGTTASSSRQPRPRRQVDESVWLTFEDLLQFDDAALRAVFAAADTEVALLALTGADPRLIARILRKLPPSEATVLRHRLEHPGPLRLRDVEQAQFALAAVASRLAHEGSIELPASVRFAAAI
jgi:flagellar motor switch protein FliG